MPPNSELYGVRLQAQLAAARASAQTELAAVQATHRGEIEAIKTKHDQELRTALAAGQHHYSVSSLRASLRADESSTVRWRCPLKACSDSEASQ